NADISTLSLHDALPIYRVRDVLSLKFPEENLGRPNSSRAPARRLCELSRAPAALQRSAAERGPADDPSLETVRCSSRTVSLANRSEEHTSELQSLRHLV